MINIFFIAALIVMFAALGVVITGVISMAKGGAFNEKYGNRLMQARIMLQGLALALLALAYFTSQA